jgi:hypothetical protein
MNVYAEKKKKTPGSNSNPSQQNLRRHGLNLH